ncbi:hypothetical protein [Bacillus pseudomycoides]|nr:hypothetical protein [Bacillus pseudomycoides]
MQIFKELTMVFRKKKKSRMKLNLYKLSLMAMGSPYHCGKIVRLNTF